MRLCPSISGPCNRPCDAVSVPRHPRRVCGDVLPTQVAAAGSPPQPGPVRVGTRRQARHSVPGWHGAAGDPFRLLGAGPGLGQSWALGRFFTGRGVSQPLRCPAL